MTHYIGIDLGTTNSAICSYDGSDTRIWKSREQNDVTPSAIHIGKRDNKYVGKRAYDNQPRFPGNSAVLFKRLMGTNTPVDLPAVGLTLTPEECSAEILRALYGYLPEEIRNDPDTGTVITVPAAFNQMQKNATMEAANMADIGKVALMQEPVAAVMSVMRVSNADGTFLIYDLGGGTLDIAIADSIGGRVNLLAHGGIGRCGGRDFDRLLYDNVVCPWLVDNFNLQEDFKINAKFQTFSALAVRATEEAKISLSANEDAVINLPEVEVGVHDLSGEEIYLDVPLKRSNYDSLIADRVNETIDAVRETMRKAGLDANDLSRVVFVGGPTCYKPLRDMVLFELGLSGDTNVDPMTAVAEGASVFAESIDWEAQKGQRKATRGSVSLGGPLPISFKYTARTPTPKAKIAVQIEGKIESGYAIQVDSIDTGWSSGQSPIKSNMVIDVSLSKAGDNLFKVFVFDPAGGPVPLEQDKIAITRTAASVDAIPASHSVCIEVKESIRASRTVPSYLIRTGESLPKQGKIVLKAGESLKAGDPGKLVFKTWEGEIEDPVNDNRLVGEFNITGEDFAEGEIPVGADLECEYKFSDSGSLVLEVSVPCIGGTFRSRNFYTRQEGQINAAEDAEFVAEEGKQTLDRVGELNEKVEDLKLEQARQKLEAATSLSSDETDAEKVLDAREKTLEAKQILAQVKKDHMKESRQMELDGVTRMFEKIREHARDSEASVFENLARTAQRSIDRNESDFEDHLSELHGKIFGILWRQDWFVVAQFKNMVKAPYQFSDKQRFAELAEAGLGHMHSDDIDKLREVVSALAMIRLDFGGELDMTSIVNILQGTSHG